MTFQKPFSFFVYVYDNFLKLCKCFLHLNNFSTTLNGFNFVCHASLGIHSSAFSLFKNNIIIFLCEWGFCIDKDYTIISQNCVNHLVSLISRSFLKVSTTVSFFGTPWPELKLILYHKPIGLGLSNDKSIIFFSIPTPNFVYFCKTLWKGAITVMEPTGKGLSS